MIAVIAGTGNLPQQACLNLLKQNKPFFVISLFPQDNAASLQSVIKDKAEIFTKEFYKVGKILQFIKEKNTNQILFIGKVDKRNLLKKIKFDWLAIKLLTQMTCKNDNEIMETILLFLKKEGIEVIKQNEILQPLLAPPGILTGNLTPELKENIAFGMQKAIQLSTCNVGQTVVIKDKMVIAAEAIEGTNECIKRGITLGKHDVIICKTAHEKQNKKYDLPTLGPNTLNNLKTGQVKAIAWQSDKTFIAQKEEFIKKATELKITLISIGKDEETWKGLIEI